MFFDVEKDQRDGDSGFCDVVEWRSEIGRKSTGERDWIVGDGWRPR